MKEFVPSEKTQTLEAIPDSPYQEDDRFPSLIPLPKIKKINSFCSKTAKKQKPNKKNIQ